jgi:hypothetical protein
LRLWILTAVGICLLASNVYSQEIVPDLRFHIDLQKVGEAFDELNMYPEAVWDTIPPFDFTTIKLGSYHKIPHFLKRDLKRFNRTVEYGAPGGYRMRYTCPKVYSFDLREITAGEYYTYEPRDVTIPGLVIEMASLDDVAEEVRVLSFKETWRESVVKSVTSQQRSLDGRGGGLISVDIPLPMPSQLESIFGPGDKTHITITGREEITFAGESKKVEPFIGVEGQQKQSLFPSLEMEQKLDVTLSGTVGDKVFIQVDHSSQPMFDLGNNIQLYYVGYEDDVIKRIDLGNTNLSLTGSNLLSFSTASAGLFGVKMLAQIGSTELTVIASKQEGETSSSTFSPSGAGGLGHAETRSIRDIDYIKNRYFYFIHPDPSLNDTIRPVQPSAELLLPDNSDPKDKEIQVWQSVEPNELSGDHTWNPQWANAFVDSLDNGDGLESGAASIAAGDPIDSDFLPRQFRLLEPEVDYDFIVSVDNPNEVVGFVMRRSVEDSRVLAVRYTNLNGDPIGGTYTDYEIGAAQAKTIPDNDLILKLIKAPNPQPTGKTGFVWHYMMRNFYNLGLSNIDVNTLELEIYDRTQRLDTSSPPASTVPYIQIFGLDRLNAAGEETPDGIFDATTDVLRSVTGVLQFPTLFPFAPPSSAVALWTDGEFSFANSLYAPQFEKAERIYKDFLTNPIVDAYQYDIVVRAVSTSKTIRIDALNIVENSEKITVDGRTLTSGTDYTINYDTGEVELKNVDLTPTSKISVDYEFTPFGGGASSSLVGFSTLSKFSESARFGSIFLYESKATSMEKPRLGEEPTRAIVGGINGQFQHNSRFLTRIANLLPMVDTDSRSTITVSGEVAASIPDPNTKGEAYIEDFEGIEDSDRISTSRRSWYPASRPMDPGDTAVKKESSRRQDFIWYNIEPTYGAHRRDFNPELDEKEDTAVPTLDIELDAAAPQDPEAWVGVMTGFGSGGLDLSRGQYLEVWVNDFKINPINRGGFLRIDIGRIDENFYEPDSLNWDDEDVERDGYTSIWDDTGLDGAFNTIPEKHPPVKIRGDEGGLNENDDVHGDDYNPKRIGGRFSKINGTEKNYIHDTEDLDRSGQMETFNSYFSYVIDLSDTAVVDIRESYPGYDRFNEERYADDSWRLYRIKLTDRTTIAQEGVEPQLEQVRHVRVWIDSLEAVFREDGPGRRRFQFAELKIVGNRWELDGVRDAVNDTLKTDAIPPTEFTIGAISTKTDPGRYNPPIVPRVENEVYEKEQSMFLRFEQLGAETSVRIFRQFVGRGLDLTSYRDLNFWVHADPDSIESYNGNLEYYFRMAFDKNNYYEISFPITREHFDPSSGWSYTLIKLEDLTSLKLGEPDLLFQIKGKIRDVIERTRQYDVKVVNNPNVFDIRFMYAGVRNISQDVTDIYDGVLWLNDIYAGDVRRDIGMAERASANINIAGGVLSVGGSWQRTDADFRGLRERRGKGVTSESFSMNAKTRVEHFIPLFGFSVPLSANYSTSTSVPRYVPGGDTELDTKEEQDSLRTQRVSRSFSTSLAKKGSQNPFFKYTLDKMSTSFSFSQQMNRTPTARDTSQTISGSASYQINWTKTRDIKLWRGIKLRYWPNAFNFKMNASRRTATRYRYRNGVFVKDPFFWDADLKMSGSTNYQPFRSLTSSFNGAISRKLYPRRPHLVMGVDIGLEVGRSHRMQISFKPPKWYIISAFSPDISLNTGYTENSGPTVRRQGDPAGTRNVNNTRNAGVKMGFDVGKYFGKLFGKFGWLEDDPQKGGGTQGKSPGTRGGVGGTPGAQPDGQPPAEEDTTQARPKADPMIAVRKFGRILKDIRPLNITVQQRFNSSYSRIPYRPTYLYQFALTPSTGILDRGEMIDKPDRQSTSLSITLVSGVQLTSNIDLSTRFGTTLTNSATQGSETESQTTTWPDLGFKWQGLERLGLFRAIFSSATASATFKQQTTESGRVGTTDTKKSTTTLSPSMMFGFKNGINSTLGASYNKDTTNNRGSITESGSFRVTLDFKKDFRGGTGFKLPIPFFAKEVKWTSTLNSDVRISYSRSSGKRYDEGSELFQPIPMVTSLSVSPGLTYHFSEALNGRFFVDYTRAYAQASDQTTTSLRVGISAVLRF